MDQHQRLLAKWPFRCCSLSPGVRCKRIIPKSGSDNFQEILGPKSYYEEKQTLNSGLAD